MAAYLAMAVGSLVPIWVILRGTPPGDSLGLGNPLGAGAEHGLVHPVGLHPEDREPAQGVWATTSPSTGMRSRIQAAYPATVWMSTVPGDSEPVMSATTERVGVAGDRVGPVRPGAWRAAPPGSSSPSS
ncbi:MAG: hypothetical protein MZU95_15745 [Desulfomicrobium escambiense]|nr:hypothetical protein [Desulfomicrobium escambiense]